MARVVMFDVMGVRWLLTNDVNTTRVGELDDAVVVIEVDERREGSVRVHKNRDGSALVMDGILKRAILRQWHGTVPAAPVIEDAIRGMDVGPRYVDTDALTLSAYERQVAELGATNAKLTQELATERQLAKTANDANHKLLTELGKFREQETRLRHAARAGGGETVVQAIERLERTTTCSEHDARHQHQRANRLEREREELARERAAYEEQEKTWRAAVRAQGGEPLLGAIQRIDEQRAKLARMVDELATEKANALKELGADLGSTDLVGNAKHVAGWKCRALNDVLGIDQVLHNVGIEKGGSLKERVKRLAHVTMSMRMWFARYLKFDIRQDFADFDPDRVACAFFDSLKVSPARGEDATAIAAQRDLKSANASIESWATAWAERITKLRNALHRDIDTMPKAVLAYELGMELPWRASIPGVLGVGHRSTRAQSVEGAAELLEEGLRADLQERIDAARGELDTLATTLEER